MRWLRRLQRWQNKRKHVKTIKANYEAAAKGRRVAGWKTTSSEPNDGIAYSVSLLRDRSRDLIRNDPHAARAVRILTENFLSDGINPRSHTGDEELDQYVNKLWEKWSKAVDIDGLATYDGLMSQAIRAWLESGDVWIRRQYNDQSVVPLSLQLLESEFVPSDFNEKIPHIVQGIELDKQDRRIAVHMFKAHPAGQSTWAADDNLARIPWEEVAQLYDSTAARPGQLRGVPWLTPVMRKLRDLEDYRSAERERKKSEACLTAVVTGGDPDLADDNIDGLGSALFDSDGNIVEKLEPGLVSYVREGKSIQFLQPVQIQGYQEYLRAEIQTIATGIHLTYELLSGDLSKTNYSSIRAGLIEFRRTIKNIRSNVIVPLVCKRIWNWWIDSAIAIGALPVGEYPVKWSEPHFDSVDPKKEAEAYIMRIRAGIDTLTEVLAQDGDDFMTVIEERATELRLLDERGIVLDSDPRHGSGPGANESGANEVYESAGEQ